MILFNPHNDIAAPYEKEFAIDWDTTHLKVLHFEDDIGWQNITHDIIKEIEKELGIKIRYNAFSGDLVQLKKRISAFHSSAILLFDLRHQKSPHNREIKTSEFSTLAWIADNAPNLLKKHEIIILSAFLPNGSKHLLSSRGVQIDKIFEKDSWHRTRDSFHRLLANIFRHNIASDQSPNLRSQENDQFLFQTSFFGEGVTKEGILISSGREYFLEGFIHLPEFSDGYDDFVGEKLVLLAHGSECDVFPLKTTLTMPSPGNSVVFSFSIMPQKNIDFPKRIFSVMLYIRNGLLAVSEYNLLIQ